MDLYWFHSCDEIWILACREIGKTLQPDSSVMIKVRAAEWKQTGCSVPGTAPSTNTVYIVILSVCNQQCHCLSVTQASCPPHGPPVASSSTSCSLNPALGFQFIYKFSQTIKKSVSPGEPINLMWSLTHQLFNIIALLKKYYVRMYSFNMSLRWYNTWKWLVVIDLLFVHHVRAPCRQSRFMTSGLVMKWRDRPLVVMLQGANLTSWCGKEQLFIWGHQLLRGQFIKVHL